MNSFEEVLKNILIVALLFWNTIEGSVLENEYPSLFVQLYPLAIWRLFLVLAVFTGAMWCPMLGLLLAYAIFFYVMDMEVTMDKWK